jgi:MFS family permease
MTPAALSVLMTTFPEGAERNRALGIWGSTGAVGGTAAWLIGVAILLTVAVSHAHGTDPATLTAGYCAAVAAAIVVGALGALAASALLGRRRSTPAGRSRRTRRSGRRRAPGRRNARTPPRCSRPAA